MVPVLVNDQNLNRIKAVLAEKHKSNKDLAEFMRCTESSVSRWCTNAVQPSIKPLAKIAKWLDVDTRELLVSAK
ncbi:MAG: helix-turn-helix transcriptional regulator [Roseivirga sp.]|nr:helix-turn-helix transcriptional regulator [Roseivirga sp.]